MMNISKTNLEDRLRNLHDPGFEGEDDVRVVRGEFDLHQAPDASILIIFRTI